MRHTTTVLLGLLLAGCAASPPRQPASIRVATFNVALNDDRSGGLIARLEAGDPSARQVAEVIRRVRPDVLLLNELDYDAAGRAADLFQQRYLEAPAGETDPIRYPYRFLAAVNTGVPSGMDLDGDGRSDGPGDAWGYGRHPGQYGMLVLSRFPIDAARVRTFQLFRWTQMPDAQVPQAPRTSVPFYPPQVWSQLRLSSKSHWDVPLRTPFGTLHLLASHPTPPVFDGPEDRNGTRNHDEIRLWADYIDSSRAGYLVDDRGQAGGLRSDARFVIAGDLNADPVDGDSAPGAIEQLLAHPRVDASMVPRSAGGIEAATRGAANATHRGDPAHDTGEFGERVGNMRLDYVLPSRGISVRDAQVYWPRSDQSGHADALASDHRLVWIDIAW